MKQYMKRVWPRNRHLLEASLSIFQIQVVLDREHEIAKNALASGNKVRFTSDLPVSVADHVLSDKLSPR